MVKIRMEVMLMKVKEIMTKQVATLNEDDNVEHAAELMKEYNVGSIPITFVMR